MWRFQLRGDSTLDRHPAKNTTNTESKQLTEFVQICKMFDCAMQL